MRPVPRSSPAAGSAASRVRGSWFIALPVPTDSWWSRVCAPPASARLFAPADVHLTVAFLGPVDEKAAEAAFELAPQWPTGTLAATLTGVVAMGNPRRPSAFSVMVGEGAEEIARAIASVRDDMCGRAGARCDDRPPLPHVTIARPNRSAGRAEREAMLAWAQALDLGTPRVRLTSLALYTRAEDRSVRLFREHARYELPESSPPASPPTSPPSSSPASPPASPPR